MSIESLVIWYNFAFKTAHLTNKQRQSQSPMYHHFWLTALFVENVKNRIFLKRSTTCFARATCRHLTRIPFVSAFNSLHASVCSVPIGHPHAELLSRNCTRVHPRLAILSISTANFPMLRQWGNCRFSSTCHAPAVHPSGWRPLKGTRSWRHLGSVQISASYSEPFGLELATKDPTAPKVKQTNKQSFITQIV